MNTAERIQTIWHGSEGQRHVVVGRVSKISDFASFMMYSTTLLDSLYSESYYLLISVLKYTDDTVCYTTTDNKILRKVSFKHGLKKEVTIN